MTNKKTCFVIMPSGGHQEYGDKSRESDFIYSHIIAPAVEGACGGSDSVKIIREADNSEPGSIDRRIVHQIASADIVIVDITGHNPNVFLELGMRYALRKSITILLRQESTSIPFDITTYRCVKYDPKWEGSEKAKSSIQEAIESAFRAHASSTDSLVYNALPDLKVEFSLEAEKTEVRSSEMTWNQYWEQIKKIESLMRTTLKDVLYHPDALIGLTNGGMMFADLLGRSLFYKTPVVSFWVDRWNKWFENPINESVINGLKQLERVNENLELLLVDDIVATGKTSKEAWQYLSDKVPEAKVYFLPLFSGNERYFELIKEQLIWFHPAFQGKFEDESEIESIHKTDKRQLPYDKDIRS